MRKKSLLTTVTALAAAVVLLIAPVGALAPPTGMGALDLASFSPEAAAPGGQVSYSYRHADASPGTMYPCSIIPDEELIYATSEMQYELELWWRYGEPGQQLLQTTSGSTNSQTGGSIDVHGSFVVPADAAAGSTTITILVQESVKTTCGNAVSDSTVSWQTPFSFSVLAALATVSTDAYGTYPDSIIATSLPSTGDWYITAAVMLFVAGCLLFITGVAIRGKNQ